MQTIYTIGHSLHSHNNFSRHLSRYHINCVVDVRSVPFSKHAPQFNMNEIKHFLKVHGIYYIFMGEEFGARRTDKSLFTFEGYLDFEKVMASSLFISGMERVKSGLGQGYNIALMCTEKDPIDCHRNILVARAFHRHNFNILNIFENGTTETQQQLEERLLNIYFPNRKQKTLLDILEGEASIDGLLEQAYRMKNRDIGYRGRIEDGSKIV